MKWLHKFNSYQKLAFAFEDVTRTVFHWQSLIVKYRFKFRMIYVVLLTVTITPLSFQVAHAQVSGKVMYTGAIPSEKIIKPSTDPFCSMGHQSGINTQRTLVSKTGGLSNVFVYIKTGLEASKIEPNTSVILDQKGCEYYPHVLGVRVGQTLTVLNSDDTFHNVRASITVNDKFNLAMPIKGMSVDQTFAKPEIMAKLKCDVHPWMSAFVGVMEHDYFAVTDEKGEFNLPKLPEGRYVVSTWHEDLGELSKDLIITNAELEVMVEFKYSS